MDLKNIKARLPQPSPEKKLAQLIQYSDRSSSSLCFKEIREHTPLITALTVVSILPNAFFRFYRPWDWERQFFQQCGLGSWNLLNFKQDQDFDDQNFWEYGKLIEKGKIVSSK